MIASVKNSALVFKEISPQSMLKKGEMKKEGNDEKVSSMGKPFSIIDYFGYYVSVDILYGT